MRFQTKRMYLFLSYCFRGGRRTIEDEEYKLLLRARGEGVELYFDSPGEWGFDCSEFGEFELELAEHLTSLDAK